MINKEVYELDYIRELQKKNSYSTMHIIDGSTTEKGTLVQRLQPFV